MKKMILAIAAAVIMGISASAAEVTGSILSTNIGTLIDGAPCRTYNVDGRTFVIAEDLRGYGFDVVYDDSIRRLTITQNPYSERTILSKEEINIEKSSITVGQWLGDMFATDITVYLGDEQIEGYAIDGQMVIPVRALEKFAYVEFDERYKVVFVNGLQHYLTLRYESSNTNVAYKVDEKEVNVYHNKHSISGALLEDQSISVNSIAKMTYATDIENGNITADWGQKYEQYGGGTNYYGVLYDVDTYKINDMNGNLLYEFSYEQHIGHSYGYLRNSSKILYLNDGKEFLYSTCTKQEKDYYCYWPSEAELTPQNLNFVKFTDYNELLADNGYLCKTNDDGALELIRHNITDADNNYYLAKDGKLYRANQLQFSHEVNSIFDECIGENIVKVKLLNQLILKDDNILYQGFSNPKEIVHDIKDFDSVFAGYIYHIATIDKNDTLCIGIVDGVKNDFKTGNITTIDSDVKSVYAYDGSRRGKLCYIKNNNELYRYDIATKEKTKLADNIRKIISSELFITTNDELTDLTNIIATNVKDATDTRILTNDNTIIDRTTGEQISPQP